MAAFITTALLSLLALLVAANAAPSPAAPPAPLPLTLADIPIVGGNYTSLDGRWSLINRGHTYPQAGHVPGDLISDLVALGKLPDPLYENNFLLNASLWNNETWTYQRTLTLSVEQVARLAADEVGVAGDVWLVFDGIKMGANVSLNGVLLTTSRHQFTRHELSLRSLLRTTPLQLKAGANTLEVVFDPDIDEYGQFMACSGGWDWAPVSHSVTRHSNQAAYTRGIWKNVYTVDVDWLAITAAAVTTAYTGAFPTTPLQPGKHADFELSARVHLYALQPTDVSLAVVGDWRGSKTATAKCSVPAGNSSCVVRLPVTAAQIDLWWPNGRGAHPLYNVSIAVTHGSNAALELQTWRRTGFRVFHIVTGNDTDAGYVAAHADDNGSDSQGLRYRVNGEPIFARGGNMIPIDMLEARYSAEALRRVVLSAADGGMNLVRVWAGGIWQNDVFYDTADEAGVMIYHDQIGRGSLTGRPEELPAYVHQLRRLQSHPAIVAWDGCNECFPWSGGGIVPTLMDTVVATDDSRPIWPACPAEGWTSGVNRLTGLPNGRPLVMADVPLPWGPMDTHGPYQHGDGFPAVNGDGYHLNLFDPMTPPTFDRRSAVGLQYNHTFTSEFGAVHWQSFESLSATFHPSHWSLHGGSPPDNCTSCFFCAVVCNGTNVIAQRNYPSDSLVIAYFGGNQSQLDEVGRLPFMTQLFKSLVGSALIVKGYVEQHRANNTFGLMTWQLNEVWPTGGWGSLEFGRPNYPGQVVGGRWKPTHYWLRESLYTDVIVSCGQSVDASDAAVLCYVKLDAWKAGPTRYVVAAEQHWLDGSRVRRQNITVTLPPGPGSIDWFTLDASWASNASVVHLAAYEADAPHHQPPATTNFYLAAPPSQLVVTPGDLGLSYKLEDGRGPGEVRIVLTKGEAAPALFLTLTTLAAGRFSRNCFHMLEQQAEVTFIAFGELDRALLEKSLRWETYNLYSEQQPQQKQQVFVPEVVRAPKTRVSKSIFE